MGIASYWKETEKAWCSAPFSVFAHKKRRPIGRLWLHYWIIQNQFELSYPLKNGFCISTRYTKQNLIYVTIFPVISSPASICMLFASPLEETLQVMINETVFENLEMSIVDLSNIRNLITVYMENAKIINTTSINKTKICNTNSLWINCRNYRRF